MPTNALTSSWDILRWTRTWWTQCKQQHPWLVAAIFFLLSMLTVGTVHVAGFIFKLPYEILPLVIVPFADNILAIASLYLILSLGVAKVIIHFIVLFVVALLQALNDWSGYLRTHPVITRQMVGRLTTAENIFSVVAAIVATFSEIALEKILHWHSLLEQWRNKKSNLQHIRSDEISIGALSALLSVTLQIIFTSLVFFLTYLKWPAEPIPQGSLNDIGAIGLVFFPVIIILLLGQELFRRTMNHEASSVSAMPDLILALIAGVVLWIAFFTGAARFEYLSRSDRAVIQDGRSAGRYRVLLRSDDEKLLLDDRSRPQRLIISSPHEVLTYVYGELPSGRSISFPGKPTYRETGFVDHRNGIHSIQSESGREKERFLQNAR